MYDVAGGLLEIAIALGRGYCLQAFWGRFLKGGWEEKRWNEKRWNEKRWNGMVVMLLYGGFRLALGRMIPDPFGSAGILERLVLILIVLFGMAFCLYRAQPMLIFFVVFTFLAAEEISFFLSYMVLRAGSRLFVLWGWCMNEGYFSSGEAFETVLRVTAIGVQGLAGVVFILVLYLFLGLVAKSFREKDHIIHKAELLFILMPSLAGLFSCVLLRLLMITVEDGVPQILYDKKPAVAWIVPAIMLTSLSSILYGVKLFQNLVYAQRERNSRIILEQQINGMREQMEELERVYSGMRSMKHDMKNTLSVVLRLAAGEEAGESAQLREYLNEINRSMEKMEPRFRTGNTVVDTLLNMKYHEAVRTIPDVRIDADGLLFPKDLLIQSYDVGVILGNAVDNAMEGCRKLRRKDSHAEVFIRLLALRKGNMFLIGVENSFDGTVVLGSHSDFPETDKEDKETHGIGLANIARAAEKYHGAVEWSAENGVFSLWIMMRNERS